MFYKIQMAGNRIAIALSHAAMLLRCAIDGQISVARGVKFRGLAMLDARKDASISIGAGTTINSSNFGYHVGMWSPVKMLADRPGARIEIGPGCRIHGSAIHAQDCISIGEGCLIAANCQIVDGIGHDLVLDHPETRGNTSGTPQPISIGNNVWLGTGVIILPGVTIGDGTVVGAGAVVTKDLPPQSLAVGNPARVIRQV